jgi:hypothetical protein
MSITVKTAPADPIGIRNPSAVRVTNQNAWPGNTQFIEQNLKVFGGLLAMSRQITDFTFVNACSVKRHNRRFCSQVWDY